MRRLAGYTKPFLPRGRSPIAPHRTAASPPRHPSGTAARKAFAPPTTPSTHQSITSATPAPRFAASYAYYC